MRVSPQGLALIQQFEGFSATVYRDAAGLSTIGYGHLLRAGEVFSEPLSEAAALQLLAGDVAVAERAIGRFITVALAQYQFDALVSFTFNLGAAVLQRSTLRRVLNQGDYVDAAVQWRRYVFAGGCRLASLVRRRQAEVRLFQDK